MTAGTTPENDGAARLAERLGVQFHDLDLLRLALTHRSVVQDLANANPGRALTNEEKQTNERLEFLGDAVLGYVAAEYLYKAFPDSSEGALTAQRVALVRAEQLVRWARELELADFLLLGQGERVTESARDRMLGGAFEAIVAAIALDRGMRAARTFLRGYIERDAAKALARQETANAKGRLQEVAQEKLRLAPDYVLIGAEGPDHARTFTVDVAIGGRVYGTGTGPSKRIAEQAAAREALTELGASATSSATAPHVGKRRRKSSHATAAAAEKEPDHGPVL